MNLISEGVETKVQDGMGCHFEYQGIGNSTVILMTVPSYRECPSSVVGALPDRPWALRGAQESVRAPGGAQVQNRVQLHEDGPREARPGGGVGLGRVHRGVFGDAAGEQPDTRGYEV